MPDDASASASPPPSQIPVEIVSEAEMAFIEAALAAASRSFAGPLLPSSRPVRRFNAGRKLSRCCGPNTAPDIEDSGSIGPAQKRAKAPQTLLTRFRSKRGLMVTDITGSEWCEKQMEFVLLQGKPKRTTAMRVGSNRHAELEEEVVKKADVQIQSVEESWAVKLLNFMTGANQLLFEGLTREIPVVGFVEGVWVVGVIDEIRMPMTQLIKQPFLVETKTRFRPTLPSEAQKRNARFQLMCYKYLWDNIVVKKFPSTQFFEYFRLDPQYILSGDVKECLARSGFHSETFGELVTYFSNVCNLLPPAHEQLLIRYEYQGDQSLLGEDQFNYDSSWVKSQISWCLKFWMGEREADYVSDGEKWKCRFCSFSSMCPTTKQMEDLVNDTEDLVNDTQEKCSQ